MTARPLTRWTAALAALLFAGSALAYDQPAVNLGFTSFLDGAPPAGPGWYFAQYVQFYTSDKLPDLPFPGDPELDAWISLSQLIYQCPKVLPTGANLGLNLMLPAVDFDLKADGTPLTARDGLGDLLVGPYLQWAPVMGANGPVFVHRVEFQVILPTGEYDETRSINPGANVVSLNPYWSGTFLHHPQMDRLRPPPLPLERRKQRSRRPPDSGIADTQAGQALHANFATEYEVIEKRLRLGLNGYSFHQITDSKANGDSIRRRQGGSRRPRPRRPLELQPRHPPLRQRLLRDRRRKPPRRPALQRPPRPPLLSSTLHRKRRTPPKAPAFFTPACRPFHPIRPPPPASPPGGFPAPCCAATRHVQHRVVRQAPLDPPHHLRRRRRPRLSRSTASHGRWCFFAKSIVSSEPPSGLPNVKITVPSESTTFFSVRGG
jgi:hypothetical protein